MRYLKDNNESSKIFEAALGFITRSVLQNPIHSTDIQALLPDYILEINSAIASSNPVIAADSLTLVHQFLLMGKSELALNLVSNPDSKVLKKSMESSNHINVKLKASLVASQFILKHRGEDTLDLYDTIIMLANDADENLRRNATLFLSHFIYFKVPTQFDSVLAYLVRQIDSKNPKLRLQALEALSHIPQHGEELILKMKKASVFQKINKLIISEPSPSVLQPLIQRVLRKFCTFASIRSHLVEIGLLSHLHTLTERNSSAASSELPRNQKLHAQILRIVQILRP
ncbi:unnamed protein product [Oikopleura dioica]|uniref:Clathrin/coatomer adaptor adaptin-like N-terminal domain-containing protein n=1 Tax=Oikopleura dioica TaxID=34765 RepID=E4Y450_OIKDI|nr:unnamed protein product [Oikopleura dioica]